jgi:hypothetical protein
MKVAVGILLLAITLSVVCEDRDLLKRSLAPKVPFSRYPFATLVLGTGSNQAIEYVCTGSILDKDQPQSHILTTAFCVQDRQDQAGNPVNYSVLIEDPNGNITLAATKFSRFEIEKVFMHPNASRIAEFIFTSKFPNGTTVDFNVAVAPYDLAVIRLKKSLKSMTGITPVRLSKTLPKPGDRVRFVGYGGPLFFALGATAGTEVIPSFEINGQSQIANGKLIFVHDTRQSILPNETESVEPGDEGSPLIGANEEQVGLVVGSWQINPNTTNVITFATLGPAIAPNHDFIQSIVHEQKVRTSSSEKILLHYAAVMLVIGSFMF